MVVGLLVTFVVCYITCFILWRSWRFANKTFLSPTNKAVFISGCDTGIGHRLALLCHDQLGLTVFAGCLEIDGSGAQELRAKESCHLSVVPLDVTSKESVEAALHFVQQRLKKDKTGLWGLINNAGVCVIGEFEWQTWKQCQSQLDVNIIGSIRLTKAFLKLIRKGKGRIITITSVNGQCAYPGTSVYSATKFALEGFSDALRREMVKFGVPVIVVQPGDFARLTNIMRDHESHARAMWDALEPEERLLYDDYFHAYHRQVALNQGITSPPNFESSPLLSDIHHALLSPAPRARYGSFPFTMKVIFFLLKALPTSSADALIVWVFKRAFKADLPLVQSECCN